MSKIPPAVVALKALMRGHEVTMNDHVYGMNEANELLARAQKITNGKMEPVWVVMDITLAHFIGLFNNMSDEDLIGVVATLGLNER